MTKGTVTHTIKRCKGCVFWQIFSGDVINVAMRKMMNIQVPRRHGHACMLRFAEKKLEDGTVELVPTRGEGKPGPRYGKRIGPNGTCEHHTRNRQPYRRPQDTVQKLKVQTPDTAFPAQQIFDTNPDRERIVIVSEPR